MLRPVSRLPAIIFERLTGMKDCNSTLAYLIVKEYVAILYQQFRSGVISADKLSRETCRYVRKMGLPREVAILTICVYIALL
jgi:hypothetical protein